MSQGDPPNDEKTSIETPIGARAEVPLDEPTLQGASYMVERITPGPPQAPRPPTRYEPTVDAPTAAVQSPSTWQQPPAAPVRVEAPRMDPAMAPIARGPADAPPTAETAYVPVPGAPIAGRETVISGMKAPPAPRAPQSPLDNLLQQLKGSKNARLGLIAGCGVLGILAVFVLFNPQKKPPPPPPMIAADPTPPEVRPPPPPKESENLDPALIKEKDTLLEQAVLAVELGKTDEALNLFEKYSEKEPSPAAEFMVQLLRMQSKEGKDQ